MQIRIVEHVPGELVAKAEDAVRVIEQLSGRSLMKAATTGGHEHPKPARQIEYKAAQGSVEAARKDVARIKALMDQKIAEVLDG